MGLHQEQLEDATALRKKVTESFRDFLPLVKEGAKDFWVRETSKG